MNKLLSLTKGVVTQDDLAFGEAPRYGDVSYGLAIELALKRQLGELSVSVSTYNHAPFAFVCEDWGKGLIRCEADGVYRLNSTELEVARTEVQNGHPFPMVLACRTERRNDEYLVRGVVHFADVLKNDKLHESNFRTWVKRVSGWRDERCHYFLHTQIKRLLK
jgi:hypothetical protein